MTDPEQPPVEPNEPQRPTEGRRPRYLPPLDSDKKKAKPSYSAPVRPADNPNVPPPMQPFQSSYQSYQPPGVPEGYVKDSIFAFSGRLGRLSFQAASLMLTALICLVMFVMIILLILFVGVSALSNFKGLGGGIIITMVLMIGTPIVLMIVYMVTFYVRRLHDLNRSGWWLVLVVVIGLFSVVISFLSYTWIGYTATAVSTLMGLYIALAPGTPGVNRYGPPRYTPDYEQVLGWIYGVFVMCSYLIGFQNVGKYSQMTLPKPAATSMMAPTSPTPATPTVPVAAIQPLPVGGST
jgi:uncharacterized membrane protein YhaH (DUF805 family)